MRGTIISSPNMYVFMAWCLVKHRDNFTFALSQGVVIAERTHLIVLSHHRRHFWKSWMQMSIAAYFSHAFYGLHFTYVVNTELCQNRCF